MNRSSLQQLANSEESRIDLFLEQARETGFEHIVELARLEASNTRNNTVCFDRHRQALRMRGDPRLHDFGRWRESKAFTEREKAALHFSESISLHPSEAFSEKAVKEARRYFNNDEMIYLTFAVLSVNDWVDLDSISPARVLVVEDDAVDQELLREQLQHIEIGDRVKFVPDATQALHLLIGSEGERFRSELLVIFLDLNLPGMGGIELLQRIRIIPGMVNFPVIVMTSSNHPDDIEECKRLKVLDYVRKPVTFSSFSHAVANLFHSAQNDQVSVTP